jgi:hypothetical protein
MTDATKLMPFLALLSLALAASSCGGAGDAVREKACDLAGTWNLQESRAEGSCDDRGATGGQLRFEDHGGTFEFAYHAPGMTAMSCSGTPQGEACLLELTCSGAESGAEVAFELEVDPERNRLEGIRRLQLRDPPCQTTYEFTGIRVEGE